MHGLSEKRQADLKFLRYAQARLRYETGLMRGDVWTWYQREWQRKHGPPHPDKDAWPISRLYAKK